MAIVLGVSNPSGMAVTSLRPVRRASARAMKKNIKSPNNTPIAVPGTMYCNAKVAGKPNTPASRLTVNSKSAMLSNIKPKNALTSPAAAHWMRFLDTTAPLAWVLRIMQIVSLGRPTSAVKSWCQKVKWGALAHFFAKTGLSWYHKRIHVHRHSRASGRRDRSRQFRTFSSEMRTQ